MSAYLTDSPQATDLTNEFLQRYGFPRLYGGAYWRMRFQVLDAEGAGKDLTGALAVWKLTYGEASLTRKSGVTSTGAPTAQIVFDSQDEEDAETQTGTGWMTLYCYAVAAEVTEFAEFFEQLEEGEKFLRGDYELSIKFGDGVIQHPLFAGKQDINQPENTFPLS